MVATFRFSKYEPHNIAIVTATIHLIQPNDNERLKVDMLQLHLPKPRQAPKLIRIHAENHNHTKHTKYCIYS